MVVAYDAGMPRIRTAGGVIGIVLAAGLFAIWSGERPHTATVATHVSEPKVGAPLAIATRTRGEIANPDPIGNLRLEGQVIDANDRPVSDARVTIDALPAQTTTTEADGSFAFEGLLARRYQVSAASKTEVGGPATTWLDARTGVIVLKLRPGAGVDVVVIDAESGAPIPGATVEVRAPTVATATTAAGGSVAIAPVVPGHWPLVVRARGYATAFDSVSASSTARSKLSVPLKHGVHVRGRIIDQGDKAVADASVWLEAVGDWVTDEADPSLDGVRSGSDGSFDLEGVARASYVVHAVAPDRATGATSALRIDRDTDGIAIRVTAGPRIAGRVVRKDGSPGSGTAVRASWPHGSRLVHAAQDGSFLLDGLPRATVWASASDGAASSKPRRFELGSAAPPPTDLVLVLDNDAAISGIVVDQTGPVEGAQITGTRVDALDAGANEATSIQEVSDSSGRFTLNGLVAGQYALSATRAPRRGAMATTTTVASGSPNVTLTLRSSGRIKGTVAFKNGGSPSTYAVRLGRGGLATAFTAAAFELEAAPGLWALWLEGPGFTASSVDGIEVKEGSVADAGTITLDPGRVLRGHALNADGSALINAEVIAGALLSGTGQRVDTGDNGPEFRSDVKRATVGSDGSFEIAGVAATSVSVVATVASGARSSPILVPAGPDDVNGITLTIKRDAQLAGTVTRNAEPVAALVNAQAQDSPLTMFTVEASHGTYHFDQLAPGRYTVAAITGAPLAGSPFYPRTVELAAGGAATLDIQANPGSASLEVKTPGAGTGLVFVTTRGGSATSALALLGELGQQDGGQWAMTPISGDAAKFADLVAGPARICLVRIPMKAQVTPSALIEQIARGGAALAASCVTTELAGASSVTIGGASRVER